LKRLGYLSIKCWRTISDVRPPLLMLKRSEYRGWCW